MIRYATNPNAWSNDDDRTLGADTSLDQCLTEAAEIGFDGIEGGHLFPQDPDALKAVLAPHGLTFVSALAPLSLLTRSVDEEKAALQPMLDRLAAMGCSLCIVAETSNAIHTDAARPLSQRPELTFAEWKVFGAKLEELAAFTAAQGLTLAYRHHMGTVVQTPEEIDRLMHVTGPALKLLFDTGHCYLGGGDPVEVLMRHVNRVAHFHARNVRTQVMQQVRMKDMSFVEAVRRGVFTVPGDKDGGVDFGPCLGQLAAASYDGWMVIGVDQDPAQRNAKEYQSLGLSALKRIAETRGLDKAA